MLHVAPAIINFSKHKNSINDSPFIVASSYSCACFVCSPQFYVRSSQVFRPLTPNRLFSRLHDVYAKKCTKKEDNAGVEFNRGFYLAPCFESINSQTTLLIDIIDSNNVPLCILWLYFVLPLSQSANRIQKLPLHSIGCLN